MPSSPAAHCGILHTAWLSFLTTILFTSQRKARRGKGLNKLYPSFGPFFSHLPVLHSHPLLFHCKQGQDFAPPLVEFLGAPASAGYNPGLTKRAAASRDSGQEEGFGRCRSEVAAGSAGWWGSRAPACGAQGALRTCEVDQWGMG